jgi:hypothetical protein
MSKGLTLSFVLLRLAISTFAQATSTQSPSVSFAYPPAESTGNPRLTINVLDTVDVEWNSNYGQTWLVLWCDEYKPEDDGKMVTYRCERTAMDKQTHADVLCRAHQGGLCFWRHNL